MKITKKREWAGSKETTSRYERAINEETTKRQERAKKRRKTMNKEQYEHVRRTVRAYTKTRDDVQGARKSVYNRLGLKEDGTPQNIEDSRAFAPEDWEFLYEIAQITRDRELETEKRLLKALREMPVYVEWLKDVKGVATVTAGWICGEFDVYRADTVSKLWQFAGLNSGMVRGTKRKGTRAKPVFVKVDELVRGDKLTQGFCSPFNKRLRAALMGVMASNFIRCQNGYAIDYYYPMKNRLEHSENVIVGNKDGKTWKETTKGHRDLAAKRYMVKMFLRDLYRIWRPLHDLEVRDDYAKEKLGIVHHGPESSCDSEVVVNM